jgi:predicted GTPase
VKQAPPSTNSCSWTPPPAWKGKYVKDPYKRFLENKLRDNFNLTGCPVQIYIRQK